MHRLFLFLFALLMLSNAHAVPPVTGKDVALMARSGYSEAEILAEVRKRRFAVPIDAAVEKVMLEGGAPAALIAKLKTPELVLSPEQRTAVARSEAAQRAAQMQREQFATKLNAQHREKVAALAGQAAGREELDRLFDGRLVRLRGSELSPYSASELRQVRLFAFYFSASWCGPCRKVTPKIVEWYRRVKAEHPEFELILVSADRDELAMSEYMRKCAMPWLAVRFSETKNPGFTRFAGNSIPRLIAVNASGIAMTRNDVAETFVEPEAIMQEIDGLLGGLVRK